MYNLTSYRQADKKDCGPTCLKLYPSITERQLIFKI